MNPQIALVLFVIGIIGLFYLDRDPKAHPSPALWLPMIWLSIGGSRVVSSWLYPSSGSEDIANAYLEGNPLDRNIQAVLMALALIVLIRRSSKLRRVLSANAPILGFFAYCLISILWSDFPDVSIRRLAKALGDVLMVLVVVTDRDRLAPIKLASRVGFLLIPTSILLMKYFPEYARGFDDITGEGTYTGVTTSKNSLGMICLVFGLASVWSFWLAYRGKRADRFRKMLAHGTVIAMVLWLLHGAHSMTSLSCFALAIGLMVATSFPRVLRRPATVHFLVFTVILVSFAVLFLGVGGGALQLMGRDSSLTGRTAIWKVVLDADQNPWFGTGYECFWLGDRLQKMWTVYRGINQAHNGYIEIALNLGYVGLLMLLFAIFAGYRRIAASLREDTELGKFRLAYFVVAVIYNFTEGAFKMMAPMWIMLLLSIMAMSELSPARAKKLAFKGRVETDTEPAQPAELVFHAEAH